MNENIWLEPIIEQYKKYFGDTALTIFDVGSRDGDDAEFIRSKLAGINVYAIDANPETISVIKDRYPSFEVLETAISNYDGTTEFTQIVSKYKDEAGSSSIQNYSYFEGATYNTITVPVTKMSKVIEDAGLDKTVIDIMKVDIEGFTYECIEGLEKYISNVKLFHLETELFDRHPGHKNNNHVIDLMTANGFLLCHTSYQWENIQDQIWINSQFIL
jgi:FkbM family methyltransferase